MEVSILPRDAQQRVPVRSLNFRLGFNFVAASLPLACLIREDLLDYYPVRELKFEMSAELRRKFKHGIGLCLLDFRRKSAWLLLLFISCTSTVSYHLR